MAEPHHLSDMLQLGSYDQDQDQDLPIQTPKAAAHYEQEQVGDHRQQHYQGQETLPQSILSPALGLKEDPGREEKQEESQMVQSGISKVPLKVIKKSELQVGERFVEINLLYKRDLLDLRPIL